MKKLRYPLDTRLDDSGIVLVLRGETQAIAFINASWILSALKRTGIDTRVLGDEISRAFAHYAVEEKNG